VRLADGVLAKHWDIRLGPMSEMSKPERLNASK